MTEATKTVVLVSADQALVRTTRAAFAVSDQLRFEAIAQRIDEAQAALAATRASVLIVDIDAARIEEIEALRRVVQRHEGRLPVIVITEALDAGTVRVLVQLHLADFLAKPVSTQDLVRACVRALKGGTDRGGRAEASVYTFMPTAGGVGCTTLALQTASLLHRADSASTCIVDLNLQQGSCADYLDIEPRFDLSEVEKNPERLDRQLFEVMLARHKSGINVLAAPARPADMRSFDTELVVRILDLAAAYFDNVVIDLPRTWFPWTETVLRGSDKVYLVAELTVPCLRQAQRLIEALGAATGGEVDPRVIINRLDARGFDARIRKSDVDAVLGERFAGGIANNYKLVREAVDLGVLLDEIDPDCNVVADLGAIVLPHGGGLIGRARKGGLARLAGLFSRRERIARREDAA